MLVDKCLQINNKKESQENQLLGNEYKKLLTFIKSVVGKNIIVP